MSRFRRVVARIQSPGGDTLSGLASVPQARTVRPGDVVVYREMDAETANDILTAPSIGAALHADVRGKYPFKKL